jgi:hypothetical protein
LREEEDERRRLLKKNADGTDDDEMERREWCAMTWCASVNFEIVLYGARAFLCRAFAIY